MKTIKRICTLLLAVMLIASFTVAAFADTVPDNTVDNNNQMVVYGDTMNTNSGTVTSNEGTITANNGTVENNFAGATVTNNYVTVVNNHKDATVTNNYGTVENNCHFDSTVVTNQAGGTVKDNYGTVTTNAPADEANGKPAGVVTTNEAGGRITDNYGTVGVVDADGKPVDGTGNFGTIKYNNNGGTVVINQKEGTVGANLVGGVVEVNYGKIGEVVGTNPTGGILTSGGNNGEVGENYGEIAHNWGTIQDNSGVVDANGTVGIIENNSGTVEQNYGTVVNNFGGSVTNWETTYGPKGTVENQYSYNVDIKTENATASDKPAGDLVLYNDLYWLNDATTTGGSVTVTPKDGYTIKQVDIDSNVGSATKNNNGWTLTINKLTSSISLLIKGEKISTPVKPTPASPATVATCKLTFELGGGTIDGKSEYSKTYSYGQHIKLPIPEKEGCTFGGWETTVRGKTVTYEGGARYTVTAAKTFTAIWIEN